MIGWPVCRLHRPRSGPVQLKTELLRSPRSPLRAVALFFKLPVMPDAPSPSRETTQGSGLPLLAGPAASQLPPCPTPPPRAAIPLGSFSSSPRNQILSSQLHDLLGRVDFGTLDPRPAVVRTDLLGKIGTRIGRFLITDAANLYLPRNQRLPKQNSPFSKSHLLSLVLKEVK